MFACVMFTVGNGSLAFDSNNNTTMLKFVIYHDMKSWGLLSISNHAIQEKHQKTHNGIMFHEHSPCLKRSTMLLKVPAVKTT